MSCFSSISISLPSHRASTADVLLAAQTWLGSESEEYARFDRFLSASNTQVRHFCVPAQEVVALRGPQDKAHIFEECALSLIEDAARKTLQANSFAPDAIQGVVCTSCSCPLIPAIDDALS